MKNFEFMPLTAEETVAINGGGLLDSLTGILTGLTSTLNGAVNNTSVAAGNSLTLISAGAASALVNTGTGLNSLLSKITISL